MSAAQWFDLAVIAVAFIAAVSGWRSGALGSVMSFVGFILGAVAGVLLAPQITQHVSGQRTAIFITLFLVLGLVVVGEVAGVVLGRGVRDAIRHPAWRTVDSIAGVFVQVVVVLLAAWFLASYLGNSSQQPLANAFRNSAIASEIDNIAPGSVKSLVKNLSQKLRDSGFQDAWKPFGQTPIVAVDAPNSTLSDNPVVAATQPSVVKIKGVANGCGKVLEGTGFVVAPNRVMSNAHVVAGADEITVDADGTEYDAHVVSYDPNADISILEVPNLSAQPLLFSETPGQSGTDALVLGYPGGGAFVASPARIREVIKLNGPDIYQTTKVTREVYTIRGTVKQGDSGGPLIDLNGQVLGVVFGAAVDDPETGFVLTASEVARQMDGVNNTAAVSTGSCIS